MKIAPRARIKNTLQGSPVKLDSFVFVKDSALSRFLLTQRIHHAAMWPLSG